MNNHDDDYDDNIDIDDDIDNDNDDELSLIPLITHTFDAYLSLQWKSVTAVCYHYPRTRLLSWMILLTVNHG